MNPRFLLALLASLACAGLAACGSEPDVTVYVALDRPFSEGILRDFEKETGLTVRAQYDVEASKTVGLVAMIREEADNPKCDVFWNNELVQTVLLKKRGLLQPYESPTAADIPAKWKDPDGCWTGFAARARVFIVNEPKAKETEPDEASWPTSTTDMLDPRWRDQVGIAKPLAGTTFTHMSILWTVKGPDWVKEFWEGLTAQNARVTSGNASLMREVSEGKFIFGYTDTDDFRKAADAGKPVRLVYPDQDPDGEIAGAIVIPNSIAMIKGCPHPENAKRLIDYVLRKSVEERLAKGPSAQIPVRGDVPRPDYVKSAEDLVTMDLDWDRVADSVEEFKKWFDDWYAE
jgi:iron(III) transport system substrate-binding protein